MTQDPKNAAHVSPAEALAILVETWAYWSPDIGGVTATEAETPEYADYLDAA